MIKGLKLLSYKEKVREVELFTLEKRQLRGYLINVYKSLMAESKEDGARFFLGASSDMSRSSGYKLRYRKLHLSIRTNFFRVTVQILE